MEAAAAAGHQPMCEALHRYNCPWGAALVKAAGGGHAGLCRWLLSQGAAGGGANAQQQQQLLSAWGLWDRSAMAAAARGGHLDLVEELWGWAHDRGLVSCSERMLCMVRGDDGEIEAWQPPRAPPPELNGPPRSRSLLMDPALVPYMQRAAIVAAAASSAVDWDLKIEMLEGRGVVQVQPGCMPEAVTAVARLWPPARALHRLNWLVQRGFGVTYLATRAATLALIDASVEEEAAAAAAAAAAASADALRELGGRPPAAAGAGVGGAGAVAAAGAPRTGPDGVSGSGEGAGAAGAGDRLQVLEFVLQHQGGVTDDTANMAAAAGLLDVLQLFGRTLSVRLNAVALMREAARAGQLQVLTWLAAHFHDDFRRRYPQVLAAAVEGGAVEVAAWLHQQGVAAEPEWADENPGPDGETFPVRAAAAGGSAAALRWLVENGFPMPADGSPYVFAIRNGDVVTLRNLRALGCRWDPHASPQLVAAARSAQLTSGCGAVVVWLEEQGLDLEKVERSARKSAQQRAAAARAREAAAAAKAAAASEVGADGGAGEGRLAAWWRRVRERVRPQKVHKSQPTCDGIIYVNHRW
ncbi:hypothetical protein HXX76_000644 [Chlamydomonas incerta]|uniref:Ankyrin repeat domain-containing protein n=1 Tax=Chlamydomonas incerta TaxID=51695 RepID=A0A835WEP5_CHLIN|nr:hypothetical protein HXX76_000644 [Chlamydomonas incerta]|eukprot:KAG2446042.1 hypothetical protein HXX76_000644 [Chlamydomonas incerta]